MAKTKKRKRNNNNNDNNNNAKSNKKTVTFKKPNTLCVKLKIIKRGNQTTYIAIRPKQMRNNNNNNGNVGRYVIEDIRTGSSNSSAWWTRTDVNSIKEYNRLKSKLELIDTQKFLQRWKNNNKFNTNV